MDRVAGNTLWDWHHLLLLPLLVPAIAVPALKHAATTRFPDPEPPKTAADPSQAHETGHMANALTRSSS